ncbi:FtsX-like permease family protein [Sphingomonas sp. Mn802worker]|uniref:FtsX-like permease family protein n=1 Tax=Sphingomonas sp. Mn802worker TaxID=629773 RepID=UPI000372DC67|nr:FtsX-like permease family protein [Sphingomonas sp. Mn802worker]
MNRFALVSFWRSLTRYRLYAALNIGGLALGIAVFLVLALYVRFETSFERWLPGYQQLYLLESRTGDTLESVRGRQTTPIAAWSAISADLPGTIGTRIVGRAAAVVRNGVGVSERVGLVDPAAFDVLKLHAVDGALPTPFRDPSSVVITQRTAAKYFGSSSPIGATLPVTIGIERHAFRVVAVIDDLPANTALDFDLLAPLVLPTDRSNPANAEYFQWNYGGPMTLVRLPDAAAAQRFDAALKGVTDRHVTNETPDSDDFTLSLWVKPFADTRFEAPGATLMVATLGIIGLLTLVIALVNYVNLATARAGLRAREVAMRKVLGGDRGTLMRHFLGEAVATALIAAVLGLGLAELGVPLINAATGLTLSISYLGWNGVLLPLVALALVVGILAGLYPAVILARVPAAAVLAAARSPGGGKAGSRIREGLVVFQFAITIALIIGTMVLAAQTRHVRDTDVGYDREQLLLVRSFGSDALVAAQRESLLHRFTALPGVRAVSAGEAVPGRGLFTSTTDFALPGVPGSGVSAERYHVMPGYFDVLGARLIAGRLFDPSRPADVDPASLVKDASVDNRVAAIVINRSAVRAFHFASPQAAVGKTIGGDRPRTIIGVIEDMRIASPREAISPTVYLFQLKPLESGVAMVRFDGDAKAMLDAARTAWRAEAPAVPFDARTVIQSLDRLYKSDDQMANLFGIGSVLAVLIGCVGLWGLASFSTSRRVREIGVRKTLGASSADVVKLLVGQFLKPVLIANLFAWPLAWFAMRSWLAGFDDRIALSPLFFVAATLLATGVALATVISQSIRAARATPAWALRHD